MAAPKYIRRNSSTGQLTETIATETGPVAEVIVATATGGTIDPSLLPVVGVFAKQYTYATLPGAPVLGQIVVVTDAAVNTWGTAITVGLGTDKVLAWWNGSAWTVVGI